MSAHSIAASALLAIVALGCAGWLFSFGWNDTTSLIRLETRSAPSAAVEDTAQADNQPYKPDLLLVEHDAVDPHKIDVKMGDWYFTVPVNRADTIFEESTIAGGELRTGFSIVGNWPGFEARSPSNIADFQGLTNERIRVSVWRACRLSQTPPPTPCTPSRWMKIRYDNTVLTSGPGIAGRDFYSRSNLPNFSALPLAGYDLMGFVDRRRGDNKILGSENDLNIYRRIDGKGRIDFAECLRKQRGYSCNHSFIWRDFFEIRINYAVQYQSQWPEIKQAVLATLDGMITPTADYVPPTPPWCDRIPFPRPPELRVPGNVKKSC